MGRLQGVMVFHKGLESLSELGIFYRRQGATADS